MNLDIDFKTAFDYDLWANTQWLHFIAVNPSGDSLLTTFQHLLGAQSIWLSRVAGTSPTAMPRPNLTEETLVHLHDGWLEALNNLGKDSMIEYSRTNGEVHSVQLRDIAFHVINHSTYHRGDLCGQCRTAGVRNYPETDWVRYILLFPMTGK